MVPEFWIPLAIEPEVEIEPVLFSVVIVLRPSLYIPYDAKPVVEIDALLFSVVIVLPPLL